MCEICESKRATGAEPSFPIRLSFKGNTISIDITHITTVLEIRRHVQDQFNLAPDAAIKMIYKGKVLGGGNNNNNNNNNDDAYTVPAFPVSVPKNAKVVVMATSGTQVKELNAGRSDPTIRGFEDDAMSHTQKQRALGKNAFQYWGPDVGQNKEYKFCRFEACTWQSFGHRPGSQTPHEFQAMQLLEQLATDPGIVAVLVERELVVGTLGEMDPIDDRLMKKKQQQGACLLGYNTNGGARIDLKLRTDDFKGFLPYSQIAATLLHELSHNWVGDHNAIFWANYGQMRVEYLHRHAVLAASGYVAHGKTSAQLAGVAVDCRNGMTSIHAAVLAELQKEMAQHGVPLAMVAPAITARCEEMALDGTALEVQGRTSGSSSSGDDGSSISSSLSARDLALAAAERRAREQQENKKENDES
mmetsp:Transcript_27770/g.50450  ORF Transcript_27770/g.50450 Transcript_27770/m.50450 type:complete len:416 (-) Transcript_27770:1162-2409(-)|eukprot:CAMPEP_0198291348 /NCGR_PEP_ID=MMETSP1449-20131203/8907_1 /TAXON_ID=420275 /ORGANISM="Attheya septentrionalis, Strain CCMP2084" /LENGTH=415 /DNA_ID=CAMNT_0043989975 /DNA_START=102 /DNA_END=1349 /DNA_ORIENTATION=-